MQKKNIIILLIIGFGIYFIWTKWLWRTFNCGLAGSYECAEYYTFKVSEAELTRIIKDIKKENPELQPPYDSILISERQSYRLFIKFYYSDTREVVSTWIRPSDDSSQSTFAFVGISTLKINEELIKDTSLNIFGIKPPPLVEFVNFKDINRDFEYFENRKQLRKFEDKILNLILKEVN